MGLLLAGCAAHAPFAGTLPPASVAMAHVVPAWAEPTEPGNGGGTGEARTPTEAVPESAGREEELRGRAPRVEQERAGALVRAAQVRGPAHGLGAADAAARGGALAVDYYATR